MTNPNFSSELIPGDSPLLKEVSKDFDFQNPPYNPQELADHMFEIMKSKNALGLSAIQIGIPYRVFVTAGEMAFFNPRIVDKSESEVQLDEGCLSFPNLFLKIKRPEKIRIRSATVRGDVNTTVFGGMTARVILHEMDHLDGIVFKQRANHFHLERGMKNKKALDRRQKNADRV